MKNIDKIGANGHPQEHTCIRINHDNDGFISDRVYENLPQLLKDCCQHFKNDKHDRDVILISSLVALSGCFPRIAGIYMNSSCHANLYCIILAPPASGKGNAKFAAQLAEEYHKYLIDKLIDDEGIIDMENISVNKKMKIKRFLISANSSAAALFEDIKNTEDVGCFMFDTELDIASTITRQDWGSLFSEMLRKCYHHERLSVSRKSDGFFEINRPKLSVLFTGTANQLDGFIRSVGDGLFSRFIFYNFETEPVWKDVSYKGGIKLNDYFSELSGEVLKIIKYYEQSSFEYNLNEGKWSQFNNTFENELKLLNSQYGEEIQSIVKRLGLITFKISMIFTALRSYGKVGEEKKLRCSEVDFRMAIELYSTFIHHSLGIFKKVKGTRHQWQNEKMEAFYNALPNDVFKRSRAIEISDGMGIPERTAGNMLRRLKDSKLLVSPDDGLYKKPS